MSVNIGGGATPLDRLAVHYESESVCPECGHEHERGRWSASTSGREVRYTRECPSCGAEAARRLRLK